jgi:hypothetical protein
VHGRLKGSHCAALQVSIASSQRGSAKPAACGSLPRHKVFYDLAVGINCPYL